MKLARGHERVAPKPTTARKAAQQFLERLGLVDRCRQPSTAQPTEAVATKVDEPLEPITGTTDPFKEVGEAGIRNLAAFYATELLVDFWDGKKVPICPMSIANKLGVELAWKKLGGLGLSGLIIKGTDASIPTIYVNPQMTVRHQRFIIAHELGHFVEQTQVGASPTAPFGFVDRILPSSHLSEDYPYARDRVMTDLNEISRRKRELFADTFAHNLLMPRVVINYFRRREYTRREMAECLLVSPITLDERLNTLHPVPSPGEMGLCEWSL